MVRFNDRYGHIAGDHCLRMVAEAVAEMAQRPDRRNRSGPENMKVATRDTDDSAPTGVGLIDPWSTG